MSKFTKDKIEELKARIRRLMVARDSITSRQVGEALGLDHKTANKLMNKIRRENTENIRNQVIEKEVGKMEMHFKMLVQIHWDTINDKERERMEFFGKNPEIGKDGKHIPFRVEYGEYIVPVSARINAAKAIVDAFEKLFKIKFDAGLFSRKLGELDLKLPIADIVSQVCKLTGENKFEWQKNNGLNKHKADVEQKPADTITNGAGESDSDTGEGKE